MDNEPYRFITHDEAADMIAATAEHNGNPTAREFKLPSGRIADVIVRTRSNEIVIYEVKTTLNDGLIDDAIAKYAQWCNRLFMAVPELMYPVHGLDRWQFINFPTRRVVGLVAVYRDAIAITRDARLIPMTELHREQLALTFPNALPDGEARLL